MEAEQAGAALADAGNGQVAGLLDAVGELAKHCMSLVGDTLRLLALELRASGARIGVALALAIMAALLAVSAWLAFVGAAAAGLAALGLGWPGALCVVGVVNLAAVGVAAFTIRALLSGVGVPRTMARLTSSREPESALATADQLPVPPPGAPGARLQ